MTLVTLSAAATLYVLNVVYTGSTGMYQFIDFNIHPAIFLGLHLLVTDPATSPRKNFGKVIFGAAYGAGVFALVPLLEAWAAPAFYDKLLCVPSLNLTVRALDRASIAAERLVRAAEDGLRGQFVRCRRFRRGLRDRRILDSWGSGWLFSDSWLPRALSAAKTSGQRPGILGKGLRGGEAREPAMFWPVLSTCSASTTPLAVASLWECC